MRHIKYKLWVFSVGRTGVCISRTRQREWLDALGCWRHSRKDVLDVREFYRRLGHCTAVERRWSR